MRMGNKNSTKEGAKTVSPAVSRNGSRKSCPPVDVLENASSSSAQSQTQPSAEHRHAQSSVDDSSAQPIQLSPYQKAILREAWQRISKKGTSNIGSLIFRRMMAKSSDIKKLFQHVTGVEGVFSFGLTPLKVYQHHSVLFVKILDAAIANLDDLRPFVLECVEYGEKHAPYKKYGFSNDMWDVFGECMTEAAREWEGWKKHRETLRAWTILVSFIVDRMRQGFESASRKEAFMQQLATPKRSISIEENLVNANGGESSEKTTVTENRDNAATSACTDTYSKLVQSTTANAAAVAINKTSKWRRQSNAVISKSPVITRSKSALDVHAEQNEITEITVQL